MNLVFQYSSRLMTLGNFTAHPHFPYEMCKSWYNHQILLTYLFYVILNLSDNTAISFAGTLSQNCDVFKGDLKFEKNQTTQVAVRLRTNTWLTFIISIFLSVFLLAETPL